MTDEEKAQTYLQRDQSLIGRVVNSVGDGWRTLTGQPPAWRAAADQDAKVERANGAARPAVPDFAWAPSSALPEHSGVSPPTAERPALTDRGLEAISTWPVIGRAASERLEDRAWERTNGKAIDALLERAERREALAANIPAAEASADTIYRDNDAGTYLRDQAQIAAAAARGEALAKAWGRAGHDPLSPVISHDRDTGR